MLPRRHKYIYSRKWSLRKIKQNRTGQGLFRFLCSNNFPYWRKDKLNFKKIIYKRINIRENNSNKKKIRR